MSTGRLGIAQGGPSFAAVLAGQVLWGIGYTFTSGAKEAWVTDEVGEEQMAPVFLHGTQVDLGGVPPAAMGYSRFGIMHYPPLFEADIADTHQYAHRSFPVSCAKIGAIRVCHGNARGRRRVAYNSG